MVPNIQSGLSRRVVLSGGAFAVISASLNPSLSTRQDAIVVGNLLGDGFLQRSPNGRTARLRYNHSMKQAEYVNWLHTNLSTLTQKVSPPVEIIEGDGKYRTCRAYTKYHADLVPYHDNFYVPTTQPGRQYLKIIPDNIGKILRNREQIMIWHLDDGTLRKDSGAVRLATHGFTIRDNELLKETLSTNFGVPAQIERTGSYASLVIPSRNGYAKKFLGYFEDIVKDEIPSMIAKVQR